MDVRPAFGMHGQPVGARLREYLDIRIDRRHHQMHVEGLFAMRPQRLHHRRADGYVGHKVPIHHIDMNPVGARRLDSLDLRPQFGEVGGQYGGSNQNGAGHAV